MKFEVINTQMNLIAEAKTALEEDGCRTRIVDLEALSEDEMCREISGVEGVIAGGENYTQKVFEAADRLKIISRAGVGVDHIDLQAATNHGVWVANTPGATNKAVGEFTIGLILGLIRKIPIMIRNMKANIFDRLQGRELASLTLGVIGTGGIGKHVIRLARGFGSTILASDIREDVQFAQQFQVRYVSLDELLSQSDVVTIHCGLDENSRGMIGEEQLSRMKNTAYLVNTARGPIVDKQSLIRCLKAGKIAGAAIDPYEPFPCAPNDPLVQLDNVLPTSWSAFNTQEAVDAIGRTAVQNLLAVRRGERPLYSVNEVEPT